MLRFVAVDWENEGLLSFVQRSDLVSRGFAGRAALPAKLSEGWAATFVCLHRE